MKTLLTLALLAANIAPAFAQDTPATHITAGIFYNPQATPQIAGWGGFANRIAGGTYSFTAFGIDHVTAKPFSVQTTAVTGIAQSIGTVSGFRLYGLATTGAAVTDKSIGYAVNGGTLAVKPLKNGFTLDVPFQVKYTSIGGAAVSVGVGIGWGK